jgi:hypothetical protein
MKILILALSLLSISAHASYFATHCSDSRRQVRWESGHNSNSLFFKLTGDEYKQLELYKIEIKLVKEMVIREENIHRCGFMSRTKVYTAKAIITPSLDHPEALDFLGGDKKFEAEVICTNHMNSRAPCPEKE